MKNKLTHSLVILVLLLSATFYSCRKNIDLPKEEEKTVIENELLKSNAVLKRDFERQNISLDSLKLNEFSNQKSFSIRWEIKWDSKFEKVNSDSVGYIYIPLKAYYKIKATDKERELININIKKYILVTVDEKYRSYDLVHIIPEVNIGSKSSEQKLILIAKNLGTGRVRSYFYANGNEIARPNYRLNSNDRSLKTMSLNSTSGCTSTLFCTFNAICLDGLNVYGTFSYDGYCTYPPYQPGCEDWTFVESREINKRCEIDPEFPTGPVLPGGGGGGGDGGNNPNNPNNPYNLPYVFIKPDPCSQKYKISQNQSSYVLRSKASQILSHTNGNEWGANHNLAELPLLDSKEILGADLNYLASNVTEGTQGSWDSNFTWNHIDGYTIGSTHLHPSNGAPSVDDVFRMIDQMNRNSDLLNSPQYVIDYYRNNVSTTIVTADATYVVTVRDWDELKKEFDIYNKDREDYRVRQEAAAKVYGEAHLNSSIGEQTSFGLLLLLRNAIVLYKAPPNDKKVSLMSPPIIFTPLEAGLKDGKPLVRDQNCPD